jgi:ubiquinone biosynthesis protein COQ4
MPLLGVSKRTSQSPLRDPATGRRYDEGFAWPRRNVKGALRAIEALGHDPDRTDAVGDLLANTGGEACRNVFGRVIEDPEGRRILVEHRDLLKTLADRERLSKLPLGTLERDYYEWTATRGFTATGLAELVDRRERSFSSEAQVFESRVVDMHDLWHILGGWGSDMYGEMHLLGCSYAQLRNPGWLIMGVLFNLTLVSIGQVEGVIYFARACAIGYRAKLLTTVDWEHMLTLPTTEVRRLVGMPDPKPYRKLDRDEWMRLQARSPFFHLMRRVIGSRAA